MYKQYSPEVLKMLGNVEGIQRVADEAFIPADPDNKDWVAYQAWIAEGNTALPPDPPTPPTTHDVEIAQARAHVIDTTLPLTQRFNAVLKLLGFVVP